MSPEFRHLSDYDRDPRFIRKPQRPRFADPITGEISILSPRVRTLRLIWRLNDTDAQARNVSQNPVRDTSRFGKDDWIYYRELVASVWAALELEVRRHIRASSDVEECLAAVLEPFQHELGFVNSISLRVDELLKSRNLK